MPTRKARLVVRSSHESGASLTSKRSRTSDDIALELEVQQYTGESGAIAIISMKELAATKRIQRVWRSTFKNMLTKNFAQELLKSDGGVTIEYMKSIRYIQVKLLIKISSELSTQFIDRIMTVLCQNLTLRISFTASRFWSFSFVKRILFVSPRTACSAFISAALFVMDLHSRHWLQIMSMCGSSLLHL